MKGWLLFLAIPALLSADIHWQAEMQQHLPSLLH